MKIIKFPQSCLLVETNNKKILVDPGVIKYEDTYFNIWNSVDAILITHKHGDHCNYDVLKNIKNIPIYSTKEVKDTYPDLNIKVVKANDEFKMGNIKIEVTKAIHGYNPLLKTGKEVFENVGYIIDDGKKRLYISSDTICFNNDYKADVVFLPITGYGVTMSAFEASLVAKDMGADLTIISHLDNDFYPVNLEEALLTFDKNNSNFKILEIGEAIEI